MEFITKMRVLPVTIFVAAFLLSVKVSAIWEGVGSWMDGVSISEADATQQKGSDRPKTAGELLKDRHPAPPKVLELAQADTTNEVLPPEEEEPMAEDSDEDMEPGSMGDPTFYTQAEVDLLQKLAERREEIEARARELNVRENLLKAAEARIDEKVEALRTLQATIEKSLIKYDEEQETKLNNLIKIYENMKPKDAGRIFEELEMNVLLQVAEKMNKRRLAPILAKMAPQKAREVTEELFRLRSLPKPGELQGG